jgi:poly-gamma-glutamate biosynthesis protein PgsC/CapC
MESLLTLSIGVGLAISLIFSELFGLAAGGMVVPGYIALYLTRPIDVLLTLGAGLVTFLIVHALSAVMIVYGRRRTVLMILVGYLIGMLGRGFLSGQFTPGSASLDYTFIGFIIPGLIAIWIDRQGLLETFSALLTAAVVVRLILIIFVGMEVTW